MMSVVTLTLFVVFVVSQFPIVMESETWSLIASLSITATVTTTILLLSGRHAPLPLFTLLVNLHTMLPISRIVAVVLAVVVTIAHITLSVIRKYGAAPGSDFEQVSDNVLEMTLPPVDFWQNSVKCKLKTNSIWKLPSFKAEETYLLETINE